MARVLIVDDEKNIREVLGEHLRLDGHEVDAAADAPEAFQILAERDIDIVLADIVMPEISGIELLNTIRDVAPRTVVILVTGNPSVETAAEAVRLGAFDYLVKPVGGADVRKAVAAGVRVLALQDERERLATENVRHRKHLEEVVAQRTRELHANESRLRLITGNMSDLVCTTDAQGIVAYASESHRNLLGAPPEALQGKPILQFVHPDDHNAFSAIVKDGGLNAQPGKVEFRFRCVDGRSLWVETIGKALLDEQGRPIGLIFSSRDISERKAAELELRQSFERLGNTLWGTIEAMASLVETRDPYTAGHQRRVADLAVAIAREMGHSAVRTEAIRMAGVVHDIGKIALPSEILNKPGQLSHAEFELIKGHPKMGCDILKNIDFSLPVADIVLQHHERMDGSGYPSGRRGDDIALEARILSVADVVEAMASHRPYRPSLGLDAALKEIKDYSGVLYDPEVANHCLNLFAKKKYQLPPLPASAAHIHRM